MLTIFCISFAGFLFLFSCCLALQKQITELKTELKTLKNLRQMDVAYLESRIDKELKK